MIDYHNKIQACFIDCCRKSADGMTSPVEVTNEMYRREWLSPLDTVIDIERLMHNTVYNYPYSKEVLDLCEEKEKGDERNHTE